MQLRTPLGLVSVVAEVDETSKSLQRFRVSAPEGTGLRLVMEVGAQRREVARPLPAGTDRLVAAPAGYSLRESEDAAFEPWRISLEHG